MRSSKAFSLLTIVLLTAGCRTEHKVQLAPVEPALRARLAPPAQELRAGLGRIAVVALRQSPEAAVPGLMTGIGHGAGPGAAMGVGAAAEVGAAGVASGAAVAGAGVGLVLLPFFALGGALYGAAASHSEAEIAQAQGNMAAALAETDLAGRIRAGVLATTSAGAETLRAVDGDVLDGFDQVLEVELRSIGFTSSGVYDPDVTTYVFASLRLRRVADDACLYERLWLYRSPDRAYFTLTADGAKLMRADLLVAADQLAAGMANDLFFATAPTKSKPPKTGRAAPILAPNFISGCPSGSTLLQKD